MKGSDWGYLLFGIFFIVAVFFLALEKDKNEELKREISQLHQVIFKCVSKGGGGFTLLFGEEEIESAVCFPLETRQIKRK